MEFPRGMAKTKRVPGVILGMTGFCAYFDPIPGSTLVGHDAGRLHER